MTLREQADHHRAMLLAMVDDGGDASDAGGLPVRIDELSREHGLDAGAALLLLLTGLTFDERRARRHWGAIVDDLQELRAVLARPVSLRTAVLDYFVNIHPRLTMPSLVGETDELTSPTSLAAQARRSERGLAELAGAGQFRDWVDHEVRRARRYGGSLGLVLADLDGFAAANETLGRNVGDGVLGEVGRRLREVAREHDRVARPGDDEFALLLPGADREETAALAERLREAVAAPVNICGSDVRIHASLGIAVYPGDAPAADTLLERAAQALYEARAGGGNRVVAWRRERRRHVRRESATGWVAHVRAPDGPPADRVELHDMSREGVAFFSETPFDVGVAVEVRLGASPDGEVARRGVVVHLDRRDLRDPRNDNRGSIAGYRVGVAFDPLPGGAVRAHGGGREA